MCIRDSLIYSKTIYEAVCVGTGSRHSTPIDFKFTLTLVIRFTTLKRGGEAYKFQVEAIVYEGGHLFDKDLPYYLMTFNQTR